MADLIPPTVRQFLKDSIKDVIDTLHKTPITIQQELLPLDTTGGLDSLEYQEFNVLCILKPLNQVNTANAQGDLREQMIQIRVYKPALEAVGLVVPSTQEILIQQEQAYIVFEEDRYKVKSVGFSEYIVTIKAQREPKEVSYV